MNNIFAPIAGSTLKRNVKTQEICEFETFPDGSILLRTLSQNDALVSFGKPGLNAAKRKLKDFLTFAPDKIEGIKCNGPFRAGEQFFEKEGCPYDKFVKGKRCFCHKCYRRRSNVRLAYSRAHKKLTPTNNP